MQISSHTHKPNSSEGENMSTRMKNPGPGRLRVALTLELKAIDRLIKAAENHVEAMKDLRELLHGMITRTSRGPLQ